MNDSGKRYIGLDVHMHYLIALGVNEGLNIVLPARRVELSHLETWTLTKQDEVVLETPALAAQAQMWPPAPGWRADSHSLGFEETDPLASLVPENRKDRCPKHKIV